MPMYEVYWCLYPEVKEVYMKVEANSQEEAQRIIKRWCGRVLSLDRVWEHNPGPSRTGRQGAAVKVEQKNG